MWHFCMRKVTDNFWNPPSVVFYTLMVTNFGFNLSMWSVKINLRCQASYYMFVCTFHSSTTCWWTKRIHRFRTALSASLFHLLLQLNKNLLPFTPPPKKIIIYIEKWLQSFLSAGNFLFYSTIYTHFILATKKYKSFIPLTKMQRGSDVSLILVLIH